MAKQPKKPLTGETTAGTDGDAPTATEAVPYLNEEMMELSRMLSEFAMTIAEGGLAKLADLEREKKGPPEDSR